MGKHGPWQPTRTHPPLLMIIWNKLKHEPILSADGNCMLTRMNIESNDLNDRSECRTHRMKQLNVKDVYHLRVRSDLFLFFFFAEHASSKCAETNKKISHGIGSDRIIVIGFYTFVCRTQYNQIGAVNVACESFSIINQKSTTAQRWEQSTSIRV